MTVIAAFPKRSLQLTHDGVGAVSLPFAWPTLAVALAPAVLFLLWLLLRHGPTSPDPVSTSNGAMYLLGRTIRVALMAALPVGWIYFFVSAFLTKGRADRQRRLELDAIVLQPRPVEAVLTSATTNKLFVERLYSWTDFAGHLLNGSFVMLSEQEPFWLDSARTKMLALSGPHGESILLDANLAWVDLTAPERARVIEARNEVLKL
jgi:hypothetical protein